MKECCKQQDNLQPVETRGALVVEQCKVCGCKHYTLHAEPGVIFAKAS